jgi:16S rRNA (cytosine967-C5)-methyltransferase
LARELTMGVVRHRDTLEAVMKKFLKNPQKRLLSPVREIMLVGLYQIIFLQRVPAFAAVDEAVEQTKNAHHKRQSGLVNGLLRGVVREISKPIAECMEPQLGPCHVPVGGGMLRRFKREIMPDPQVNPVKHLAKAWSIPHPLAKLWIKYFGLTEARRIASHSCARPPIIARVNQSRSDVESVISAIEAEGYSSSVHENGCSVVVDSGGDLTKLSVFRDGLIQPQDPTATAVVNAMDIQPGMRVLDLCAAPGTKTTHLAERMNNTGEIVAVDVSASKLSRIKDSCQRMGISIVKTVPTIKIATLEPGSFDAVLVDAPCSNTGVLARRPEARWRFATDNFFSLNRNQQILTNQGAHLARPGGQVVYSTCSIERLENQAIAEWFDQHSERLELVEQTQTLPAGEGCPEKWHDGGYFAKFRVTG